MIRNVIHNHQPFCHRTNNIITYNFHFRWNIYYAYMIFCYHYALFVDQIKIIYNKNLLCQRYSSLSISGSGNGNRCTTGLPQFTHTHPTDVHRVHIVICGKAIQILNRNRQWLLSMCKSKSKCHTFAMNKCRWSCYWFLNKLFIWYSSDVMTYHWKLEKKCNRTWNGMSDEHQRLNWTFIVFIYYLVIIGLVSSWIFVAKLIILYFR